MQLKGKRRLIFLCENCETGFWKVPGLTKDLVELKDHLTALQSQIDEMRHIPLPKQTKQPDLFDEMQDRNSRSRNVIMYNIKESNSAESGERIKHDKARVIEVLGRMDCDQSALFKVVRIGRRESKTRPVKVLFHDARMVGECLSGKKKLMGSEIGVNLDMTIMQRKQVKDLHEEVKRRRENGEKDVMIKYTNGVPQIAKLNISGNDRRNSKNGPV